MPYRSNVRPRSLAKINDRVNTQCQTNRTQKMIFKNEQFKIPELVL